MNFQQSDTTKHVAESARDFAQQYIKPFVMEWDEKQEFPVQVFKEMGKLGLMGVLVPEKYGGAGLSYFEYSVIIQEIAKVCGSIGPVSYTHLDVYKRQDLFALLSGMMRNMAPVK